MTDLSKAPFREANFPPRDLEVTRREDGVVLLKSRTPLHVREKSFPAYLRRHAERRPNAPWLAQRRPAGGAWRIISFGEARRTVDNLTQALLDLNLKPGAPLAVLSGNSLEHALITHAAMQAHIPFVPISPAYSLQSTDFVKLRELFSTVEPGAVFVQSGTAFARALDALNLGDTPIIAVDDLGPNLIAYADLEARSAGPAVDRAFKMIDPDATAKFMFTSGSTGSPKAVIQRHRNLCPSAEAILCGFGETEEGTMVRLDWTPWSHVFGATSLAMALINGGVIYIDDGRPVGPMFAETLRNLREISPTVYASVPAGYSALVDALEQDDALARSFFANLNALGYAAARLPEDVARRMQELAVKHTGYKLAFTTGYGATETCPAGAAVYWATDRVGFIGLPQPGFEFKLVPVDEERYEVRIRGEGVMSGYYRRPELNSQIFDEEGFYKMGDATTFVDPADPLEGLIFAGRLSEEFKLQTGTFVLAGSLRAAIVDAAAPLLSDVVICGEDQAFVAAMAWLNVDAARALAQRPKASREELNADPKVRAAIAEAIAAHNARHPASSTRVARVHLLDELASIDRGEMTDKGSINQRAVQRLRPELVEALFEDAPPDTVFNVGATTKNKESA